jgi:hypothetical protein
VSDHVHKWYKTNQEPGPQRDWKCVECGIQFVWTDAVWEQYLKSWEKASGKIKAEV